MCKNIPKLIGIIILFLVGIYLLCSVISYSPSKFTSAGKLNYSRSHGYTTTLLPDGRVLIAGGASIPLDINLDLHYTPFLSSPEIYDPKTGTLHLTGKMNYIRVYHTATLLKDGRVFIVGGYSDQKMSKQAYSSAEIYNLKTKLFYLKKTNYRYEGLHTSTLLKDGRVLLTGGISNKTEIYDPTLDKFYPSGDMNYERKNHSATLLADGRILIAGGRKNNKDLIKIAEIYNPKTGRFTITGKMNYPRIQHTATLLKNNRVLISGGTSYLGASEYSISSSELLPLEIYNTDSGIFTVVKDIPPMRIESTTMLKDGRVLLAVLEDKRHIIKIYDPKTNKLNTEAQTEKLIDICKREMNPLIMKTTLLKDGNVLFIGGNCDNVILYTP